MAISVSLTLSTDKPASGDTVTATYNVVGNAGAYTPASIEGALTIGNSVPVPFSTAFDVPTGQALSESFDVPACPGLTFKPTSSPNVFTAVVP